MDEGVWTAPYLLNEVSEEDGLLSQRVVDQPFGEEDHPVGEVVLREPGHHALLLHVWATGDVNDQVPQVLPVPARTQLQLELLGFPHLARDSRKSNRHLPDHVDGSGADLGVAAHDRHAGGERAVDAEDHTFHSSRQHGQVGFCARLITPWERKRIEGKRNNKICICCTSSGNP